MKLINKIVVLLIIITIKSNAQDSMFIYKNKLIIDKHALHDIDSITFFSRSSLVYGDYKPDATTTGPIPGIILTQWGNSSGNKDFVVGTDKAPTQSAGPIGNNQIVENLEIWGRVNLGSFTNVTVKNCIIHGTLIRAAGTAHVIAQGDNLRGATIIDCRLVGRPVTVPASYNGVVNPDAGNINNANEWSSGLRGGNYTILRTEIANTSDGISLTSQVGNVTAKGCWIHNGWLNEWPASQASPSSGTAKYYPYSTGTQNYTHVDGIQFHRGRNYTIIGNRIGGTRVPGDHNVLPSEKNAINSGDDMYNACLMIKQEVDSTYANRIENVIIDKNWFAGGVCSINITLGRMNYFESVYITRNRFMRSTWGTQYYVLRMRDANNVYVGNFSDNVFEDNGAPIPIGNGGVGNPNTN